jgi:biotin operon repressor
MGQDKEKEMAIKEAMKQLRAARKEQISAAAARMKQQKKDVEAIKQQLGDDAGTVPQIADATGIPSSDVLWYIAALKKYGDVVEAEQDAGYYHYRLSQDAEKEENDDDIG